MGEGLFQNRNTIFALAKAVFEGVTAQARRIFQQCPPGPFALNEYPSREVGCRSRPFPWLRNLWRKLKLRLSVGKVLQKLCEEFDVAHHMDDVLSPFTSLDLDTSEQHFVALDQQP